jgi:hypothetical protein
MIDEQDMFNKQSGEAAAILYDWFKHLTSLSLLALGGVLSLSQGAGGEIKKSLLIFALILLATSVIASFSGAAEVVKARTTGTPIATYTNILLGTSGICLSLGLGVFIYIFVKVI